VASSDQHLTTGAEAKPRLGVVCVAGGGSRRYGRDKLAEDLAGEPVLARALAAVTGSLPGAVAVVVAAAARVQWWRARLADRFPAVAVLAGGMRRQDSVRLGVEAVAARGAAVAVIHDAARPLVHGDDVTATVAALAGADGAILCAAVADTVKQVAADGTVTATVDRTRLRLAQTPQVFAVATLEDAWRRHHGDWEWTDEAALVEAAGGTVRTVLATHPNPKLTTPADLTLIRTLWAERR
jgi:2-C-methyl-D-erythritol 4-phosphate cytidylyltransferase